MIDKDKKIYICPNGHKVMKGKQCPICGSPNIKERPQVVTKEK